MESSATPVAEQITCERCEEVIRSGDEYLHDEETYCETCFNDIFSECQDCGYTMRAEDAFGGWGETYCGQCYERRDTFSLPEREYSTADLHEFQDKDEGTYITSPRLFSAEIECYYPSDEAMTDAAESLDDAIGISSDGSLNDDGVEFQTPKLGGAAGERAMQEICRVLNAGDFTTDRSTGLHIHLDGTGLIPSDANEEPTAIKALLAFYIIYEDVLLSFLPPSRRGNRYCDHLRASLHLAEVVDCLRLKDLEEIWYRTNSHQEIDRRKRDKYDNTRYAGVNIHSLLANGHLEIRYHSGTLNGVKILEWVALHQRILDLAMDGSLYASKRSMSLTDLGEKTDAFFEALDLPERARAYFLARQKLFKSTRHDNDEAVNETEVCAG